MSGETWWQRVIEWLAMLPVWFAYRLVWLAAKTGHHAPKAVYRAMWNADLNLPEKL